MLVPNRLNPPLISPGQFMAQRHVPFGESGNENRLTDREALRRPFLSAEDFDATGILAGVDLCASSYWWFPELHASADPAGDGSSEAVQATQRAGSRIAAIPRSTSAASAA